MSQFTKRVVFPEAQPEVCVTFFTCTGTNVSGTDDLERTYPAVVGFLEGQRSLTNEAALRYELVWLDNGSEAAVVEVFVSRGAQFDRLLQNPLNQGLFRAVNDVWFRGRGCRAPYVLSLEDDRLPRPDVSTWQRADGARATHLAKAYGVLRHDPVVVGVRLKHEWSDAMVAASQAAGDTLVTAEGQRYQRHCMVLASGVVWGAFSMAAVLYDRTTLLERVGEMLEGPPYDTIPYDYAEGQYAVRVGLAGLCTARPTFEDLLDKSGACVEVGFNGVRVFGQREVAAEVVPEGAAPVGSSGGSGGPCHQLFIESRPPRRVYAEACVC